MPEPVLYLHHVGELSGAENSLRLLMRHLPRERYTPVFGGPTEGPFPQALAAGGVEIVPVAFGPLRSVRSVLGAVRRVRALIRGRRVAVVHGNGPQTNVVAGLAGRLAGVPAVWHARNLLYGNMRDVDRACAAAGFRPFPTLLPSMVMASSILTGTAETRSSSR